MKDIHTSPRVMIRERDHYICMSLSPIVKEHKMKYRETSMTQKNFNFQPLLGRSSFRYPW